MEEKNNVAVWPGLLLVALLGIGSCICTYDWLPVVSESVFLFGLLGCWYAIALCADALRRTREYPVGHRWSLAGLNLISGALWITMSFLQLSGKWIPMLASALLCVFTGAVFFFINRKK